MVKPQNCVSSYMVSLANKQLYCGADFVYHLHTYNIFFFIFIFSHLQNAAKISQHMQMFASGSLEIGLHPGRL
jgi:hypothetical protein